MPLGALGRTVCNERLMQRQIVESNMLTSQHSDCRAVNNYSMDLNLNKSSTVD